MRSPARAPVLASLRARQRVNLATLVFWIIGCVVVIGAQPGLDRRLAALGSAAAGLATIVSVSLLTDDPGRRYLRSLVGTMVVVSVAATWLLRGLTGDANGFSVSGLNTRITVPLLFVLFTPLIARALPAELRAGQELRRLARSPVELWRRSTVMDRIFGGYASVVLVPTLLVGIAHHNRGIYMVQDVGLIVFFVFMYVAGRAVLPRTAHAEAGRFLDLLLLFAATTYLVFGWTTPPVYEYVEAACAGAIAFVLLRPRQTRLLTFGFAFAILIALAVSTANGIRSTTTIEFYGAIAILGYLVVRVRPLLPRWLILLVASAALVFFVAFTSDGATLRGGHYHGRDPSNIGRTYEAHQVRAEVRKSPVSLIFGRGLGGTIDERGGNPIFTHGLAAAGRDLAHVQEIHLLEYAFLLKQGFLGLLWLAAFAIGLVALVVRALEKAAREREPSLVVYAALPLLGFAAAFAAANHLQDNPLNAFTIGILVTWLGSRRTSASNPSAS